MIGLLTGTIVHRDYSEIILLTGGVGYSVSIPLSTLSKYQINDDAKLWIYHHQTENSERLIGFDDLQDKQLFIRLVSVNGLGPKGALSLLDLGRETVMQAIATGDAKTLSQASGVGPKLASKIIVELRGSLDAETLQNISLTHNKSISRTNFSDEDVSIIQSLVSMGYDRKIVENVMPSIPIHLTSVGDRTIWAIRNLHGK